MRPTLAHPQYQQAQQTRERLRRLARWLDSSITVPGTRIRFGADALLGLIPGVGDVIGLLLGSYFVYEGARLKVPAPVMRQMIGNVAFDALAGLVPVVGDLVDIAFKANQRNARLLEAHLDGLLGTEPARSPWPRRLLWGAALLATVGALVLLLRGV